MQTGISTGQYDENKSSVCSSLTCGICPHCCSLELNEVGKCQVIKRTEEGILNIYTGQCSNIAVEPIEKRPLFHFYPGSKFLSVGFYGCSFSCEFCQNFTVSQQIKDGKYHSPTDLIELALRKKCVGIAFTYNEPTIYHDYIEEVGHKIEERCLDLKLVLKTSGFASHRVIRNLCLYVHAVNIDIKGGDEEYKDVCGGWLDPVLRRTELIHDMGCHLEISYLVMPTRLHDEEFNRGIRDFIAEINENIPVHLLHFYPFHKMPELAYKPTELLPLVRMFSERLKYVYVSNSFHPDLIPCRNTICSNCGKTVIDRSSGVSTLRTECCEEDIFGTFL